MPGIDTYFHFQAVARITPRVQNRSSLADSHKILSFRLVPQSSAKLWLTSAQCVSQIRLPPSFMCLSQALSLKEPLVHAVQPLLLCFREQRIMLYIEQVIDDEPYRLRSGHPVLGIEPFQVHGNRIPPQRPLTPQIEVNIEVAQCQLAQAAVHRFAPSTSRIVGFRYRSPASLLS